MIRTWSRFGVMPGLSGLDIGLTVESKMSDGGLS